MWPPPRYRAEEVVSSECLLVTNTSSLSVATMAEGLGHPERVVGLHFFNPVAVLPLVEVVRGPQTDDSTLATAWDVALAPDGTWAATVGQRTE